MTRRTLPAALAALAALALAPTAAAAGLDGTAPAPGVTLPGMASAAAVDADPATWIVAARGDRAVGDRIARAAGARRIAGGAWEVARERARPLAAALRAQGLLDFAEPNRIARPAQAPDPLSAQAGWRDFVVGGAVAPPVAPTSPLIALVDTILDATHPEIAGSNITTLGGGPLADFHGTATATVAAAPANGVGMLGIWPGARALNVPLPNGQQILCSDSARAIARAVRAGAAVINMSYGSPTRCAHRGAADREGGQGRRHPGRRVRERVRERQPARVPGEPAPRADRRGDRAGREADVVLERQRGDRPLGARHRHPHGRPGRLRPGRHRRRLRARLAAPRSRRRWSSAAVAWIRAARPDLTPYQAAQVVRRGARDIGARGYENSTGFGALSLPGALAKRPPADDPLEPNDDVRHVDGRAFGALAPPLFNGGKPKTVAAEADVAEDPVDVYRVKLRAGHRLRATLTPSLGDPDLFVFDSHARSVFAGARIGRAVDRTGTGRTVSTVRNRGGRTTTFYVAVGFDKRKKLKRLDARYTLRVG